jgi:RNA polymerase sigma factor (sigma-70 family)
LPINKSRQYIKSYEHIVDNGSAITDHGIRVKLLKEFIEKEVSNLPPKMREIFELSRNEHLSHKEIAHKLEVSEKTVRNQINNALKILRGKWGIVIYLLFVTRIL